jgi:hypothetical protein
VWVISKVHNDVAALSLAKVDLDDHHLVYIRLVLVALEGKARLILLLRHSGRGGS